MEPEWEKILRAKVEEAESQHAGFDRERVWQGLTLSKAKRRPLWWVYSAVASLILLLGLGFYFLNNKPAERQTSYVKRELKREPGLRRPSEPKTNSIIKESSTPPPLSKRSDKTIKTIVVPEVQPIPVEVEEDLIAQVPVKPIEPEKKTVKKQRRVIQAVIGLIPEGNERLASTSSTKMVAGFNLQAVGEKETYALSKEISPFRKRIN